MTPLCPKPQRRLIPDRPLEQERLLDRTVAGSMRHKR
jgi:hypothetical protein